MPDDKKLAKVHNKSWQSASKEIIFPMLESGGDESHVLTVLQSTIMGVLLHLADHERAIRMFEGAIVPFVIDRLAEAAAERKGETQ